MRTWIIIFLFLLGSRARRNPHRKPPGQRPTEEVDRCVPQELSLDCCLENERVLGHTGRLLVDIHLLCWGLLGFLGSGRARTPRVTDMSWGTRCGTGLPARNSPMVGTSVPVPGILSHDISFHTHLPGLSIVLGFNLQHRMGRWSQEGSVRHVGGSLARALRERRVTDQD